MKYISTSINAPEWIIWILFTIAPRSDEPLPLPDGWERMETIDGKVVYVDHENNKVHWDRPTQGKVFQDS